MFLYLVLYLQDDLGYSAVATGSALLLISGTAIFSSIFAGVFSDRIPVRWLIGPGLLLTGVGLLVMTGLDGSSSWTHLIPGFIVAGIGSGIVNPPLASTAVGVVAPQQSGMASGVNTTFREIGIATGIAVYGSVFASLSARTWATPSPASHRSIGTCLELLPPSNRATPLRPSVPCLPRREHHLSLPFTPASPVRWTFCSSSALSWPLSEQSVPVSLSDVETSWSHTTNRHQQLHSHWARQCDENNIGNANLRPMRAFRVRDWEMAHCSLPTIFWP